MPWRVRTRWERWGHWLLTQHDTNVPNESQRPAIRPRDEMYSRAVRTRLDSIRFSSTESFCVSDPCVPVLVATLPSYVNWYMHIMSKTSSFFLAFQDIIISFIHSLVTRSTTKSWFIHSLVTGSTTICFWQGCFGCICYFYFVVYILGPLQSDTMLIKPACMLFACRVFGASFFAAKKQKRCGAKKSDSEVYSKWHRTSHSAILWQKVLDEDIIHLEEYGIILEKGFEAKSPQKVLEH